MTTRKYKLSGPNWQQLPDAVISVTNTGATGPVALRDPQSGSTRALKANGCQRFPMPTVIQVVSQAGRGEVTCEIPD